MRLVEVLQVVAPLIAILAALSRRAERRLVERLRGGSALTAATAIAFAPAGRLERWRLGRLARAGAVRDAGPGTAYLDEDSYQVYRRTRRRRALVVLAAVLALVAALFLAAG